MASVNDPLQCYTMCYNIRTYHEYQGGLEKCVPGIIVLHHVACRVMTNGDLEGLFV